MPLLWRYSLKLFFKIFSLCLFGFIGIGLLIRHKQFASFIAAGSSFQEALCLAFFLLASSLPLVIGLSSLIGAFVTTNRLSSSFEILSLRAAGLSFTEILAPLYTVACFLTLFNFILIGDLIPYTKVKITESFRSSTMNPLVLLRKGALPIFETAYVEMDLKKNGSKASNVTVIALDTKSDRLTLFNAEELQFKKEVRIKGKNVSIISHLPTDSQFDQTILDTQKETTTPIEVINMSMRRSPRVRKADLQSFRTLLQASHRKYHIELVERVSKMFVPLSFTILGASFGLFMQRPREKRYISIFALTILYFFLIFIGKKSRLPLSFWGATFLLFLPHPIIMISSFLHQKSLLKGDA